MRGGRGADGSAPTITLDVGPRSIAETDALPRQDPFGLDPELRRQVLPLFRLLHDRYWRVEVTGAENLPATGPALLVSNHSGALPFDGAMIITAVELHRQRCLRFLYDRFVDNMSAVATFYRRVGGAAASRENAIALLELGDMLLIFPEGVAGVAKPFTERYRLRRFSPGFARLALALDVPVIPVAVLGAEEIYPLVGRAEGVGRFIGAPYLPVTPFFPLLGLLGTLPLPTKWSIRFGKPMRLSSTEVDARLARSRLEAVRVRQRVQAMVTRLKRRRQSVFFG